MESARGERASEYVGVNQPGQIKDAFSISDLYRDVISRADGVKSSLFT